MPPPADDREPGLQATFSPAPWHPEAPDEHVTGPSQRLRALAELSGSLTDSLHPEDAADLVEQQALSAMGANGAVVMTLGDFPGTARTAEAPSTTTRSRVALTVLHAIGVSAAVKAALEHLPLDAAAPLAKVARVGEPLFLESEEALMRYPDWGTAMIQAGSHAVAIVPVWANGHLRGVLGLSWAASRAFDEDERAFVLTLGVMCAQAIMRAYLTKAEQRARLGAELANSSKSRFLATMSHELRTPLNAIIGYTELLTDGVDGPVSAIQRDHIGRVRASGQHLLGIIEELLGYARVDAGEEVVRAQAVSAMEVVEQSIVLVRPIADKKGLRIRVEGPDKPVRLHTDALKVRQILVNLLGNAVKFTDAGEIVIAVRVESRTPARVSFEITDTGRGIELEDVEQIFRAFWQQDPTLTRRSDGTGLGLSVARQLARLLGGDVIVARTAPGQGSTFALSLPVRHLGKDLRPEPWPRRWARPQR
jgi:signal transduction histidine kinase